MSFSSKSFENDDNANHLSKDDDDIDNEPLDPRIQVNL